jgi:hypothetical protein
LRIDRTANVFDDPIRSNPWSIDLGDLTEAYRPLHGPIGLECREAVGDGIGQQYRASAE